MNIAQLILDNASRAEITYVVGRSVRFHRSASDLVANIANMTEAMADIGLRSGDTILIIGSSRVEVVESILCAFNVGAVAVPVSPTLGPSHFLDIIARTGPKCCIFEDPPEPPVQRALIDRGCAMVSIKANTTIAARGWQLYRDLVGFRSVAPEYPVHAHDHPALIVHGSGSSGALKAVSLSHGRLATFLEFNQFIFAQYSDGPDALTSTAATLVTMPLTHLAGVGNCFVSLMNGQHTFLLNSFLPDVFLQLVEEARCGHILLVPSLYRSLLKEPYLRKMDKSALRFCIIGGEPAPAALLSEITREFGVPVVTAYGMTECLSGIAHLRRDLFAGVKPASCGRQMFGELSLRDASGQEQPQVGELWVRNATVHRCYVDPQLNDERIHGGWFRTGDVFFRDEDGDYFHRGRTDDMFICNGKNIYPLEIELLLSGHPSLEMSCACPVADPHKGVVPGVMVVATTYVSKADIQDYCMRQGPSHAVPQIIQIVQALPLLGPGKIDRREVQHLLQASIDAPS